MTATRVTILLLTLLAAGDVWAQEQATFPAERLRPAIDREGIIDVEWAVVGEDLTYDLALGLGYAHNPLILYQRNAGGGLSRATALVADRLSADLVGSVSFFEWVQVGLHLPITIYQGRGPPSPEAAPAALEAGGLGDLRLYPKVQLLGAARFFIDVAVAASLTFPTNAPVRNYLGEKTVTFAPELIVSRKLPGLRLAANLGFRLRDRTQLFGLRVGNEVTYRLGAAHRFEDYLAIPAEVGASLSGAISTHNPGRSFNRNPLELLVAGSYDLGNQFQATLGFGVGLIAGYGTPDVRFFLGFRFAPRSGDRDQDTFKDTLDPCPADPEDFDDWRDEDGCPDFDNDGDGIEDPFDDAPFEPEDADGFEDNDGVPDPDDDWDGIVDGADRCRLAVEDYDGYEDEDGCPDLDRDADGRADQVDACPEAAEDQDGYADLDGCPDPDNDRDGIEDDDDRCPDMSETLNGYQDNDGCPDSEPAVKVTLTRTQIEIHGKVHFDSGKSTIKSESFDLLQQVARKLKENPQIKKVEIEGHTDSDGDEEDNMILSQDRADSVRRFLIKQGVEKGRLNAVGYGETKPIASNSTQRGRAINRRVAFTITEMEVQEATPGQSTGIK